MATHGMPGGAISLERLGAFCAAYGSFLCAAHASFAGAVERVASPLGLSVPWLTPKPWRGVLKAALAHAAEPGGMILEFGVYKGKSIRYLARLATGSAVHGFDSFEGFPDDRRGDWQQDFSVRSLPRVPANVHLHAGYFDRTLPPFVAAWHGRRPPLALIHIDCDIFSSADCVLTLLGDHLVPGDVIVFDELMNYDGFARNEFLALYLLLRDHGLDFEWLATCGEAYPFARQGGRMMPGGFNRYRAAGYCQNQAVRLVARDKGGHFDGLAAPAAVVRQLVAELGPMLPPGTLDARRDAAIPA